MTATNHVLTGAMIGLTVQQPAAAIVLALISHFVLDAIPHFGDLHKWTKRTSRHFKLVLAVDASLSLAILVLLGFVQPANWVLAVVCAITAASPDLMWLPHYIDDLKGRASKHFNIVENFHSKIQYEWPRGIVVELLWAFGMAGLLAKLI